MTVRLLISGKLYGDPTRRQSQAGKPFVTARVVADAGESSPVWCSVIVFDQEPAERLASLRNGNAISASGRATFKVYESRDGTSRVAVDLVADEVAALRSKPKDRRPEGIPDSNRSNNERVGAGR